MKSIFFIVFVFCSFFGVAQDPSAVTWAFTSKPGNNPDEFILTASAKIQEGFHVFSPQPGGDGLLIPTEMTLTTTNIKIVKPLTPQRRPVTKHMEGIGMVNYFEGEIEFNMTIQSTKGATINGIMSSQCCNNLMCLPPSDVPFKVKL